jgi:uncharacterized protein YuzE
MRINYDPRADALYLRFQDGRARRTKVVEDGVLVDLDETGRLYGIEIIGMKGRIPIPELGKILVAFPNTGSPAPA